MNRVRHSPPDIGGELLASHSFTASLTAPASNSEVLQQPRNRRGVPSRRVRQVYFVHQFISFRWNRSWPQVSSALFLCGLLQRCEFFGKQCIGVRYRADALERRCDSTGLAGYIELQIRFLEQSIL